MDQYVSREGRKINTGDLVGVHWNAHKNVYSIVSMKTRNSVGLVLGYADEITLVDCTVKIDKSKQKKVKETHVKDRHAFIVGKVESFGYNPQNKKIYYNPHKLDTFVDGEMYKDGEIKELEYMNAVNFASHEKKYPTVTYQ